MTRAPLDLSGGRPTSGSELNIARQVIIRSGVVDALSPLIDSGIGRPRHLSLLGLLVACQLNALGRHHQAHLVEVARTLNAMTEAQRRSLEITDWDPDEAYHRVERLFVRLCEVLDSGEAGLNEEWFANQLARAADSAQIPGQRLARRRWHRRGDLGCPSRRGRHRGPRRGGDRDARR